MEIIYLLLTIIISTVVYFIPSYIASRRYHNNQTAIFMCNLLLGWTFLGWVGSLIWSLTDNTRG
jgi:hypothetical protein